MNKNENNVTLQAKWYGFDEMPEYGKERVTEMIWNGYSNLYYEYRLMLTVKDKRTGIPYVISSCEDDFNPDYVIAYGEFEGVLGFYVSETTVSSEENDYGYKTVVYHLEAWAAKEDLDILAWAFKPEIKIEPFKG